MLDWRATPEERDERLPGDDLLPEARGGSTHAIAIRAPAVRIWPWLVQMGCDRAGFYSYDRLDNGGRASADRILAEFQNLKVGDVLPARPGSPHGFEVLRMEPSALLLLGAFLRVPRLEGLPWEGPTPPLYMRVTWAFVLRDLGTGTTRLIVRARGVIRPRSLELLMNCFTLPGHVVMQRKQLLNLKRRVESSGSGPDLRTAAGSGNGPAGGNTWASSSQPKTS